LTILQIRVFKPASLFDRFGPQRSFWQ